MTKSIEEALAFVPPSQEEFSKKFRLLNAYFAPEFIGFDEIDTEQPTLFAANHGRFGVPDTLLLVQGIYCNTGIFAHGLADFIHYEAPWKDFLTSIGGVVGTREMCRAIMKEGKSLLVYPGGGREVLKSKGNCYQLLWERRLGFVRMAIESGHRITPVACLGNDELFDIVTSVDALLSNPLGTRIKEKYVGDMMKQYNSDMPIPRGIGFTPIPKPVKLYFKFGTSIDTKKYAGQSDNADVLQRLQDDVAESLNHALKDLMLIRAQNKSEEPRWRRLLNSL
ncbi:acyltransferase family protein [Pseudomaricurvus alcaniphilus]|uniref:lysophospholipid acyltransferase family protein n=1 Tax=Pseudomaricurvus alcaniphilus TaxID=1166482 RepID=UPI00140D944A|nr:lysophospholipid acyltransferase family protein [Pseudomaricurvus alcaniphilus]NHN36538.1 acyltransferase family protein [Pseudomaricurvus alcaniphilus]